MLGLRQKLMLGFGGVVAILLIVSALSIAVLTRYSHALEQFLNENYRSVVYGQNMKDAVGQLNDAADAAGVGDFAQAGVLTHSNVDRFERNLADEKQNVTLPHEGATVTKLELAWQSYLVAQRRALDRALSEAERRDWYRHNLRPAGDAVQQLAQDIVRMNLQNMVSVNGQVKKTAIAARQALYAMLVAGLVLAVGFVAVFSRAILQPLRFMTQSAHEIEQGNLDLVVPVRSQDELGQLAEAFNSMAAKLREFRRTDRAKLVRTQRTTQLAVNSLPDAVAIITPDGVVDLANDAAQKLFDLRPETALGQSRAKGLSELFQRTVDQQTATQPSGYESAIRIFDPKGDERFFLPHAVPVIDTNGELLGITLVLGDVTNLRQLDEMKSGMLSVVSHELKTPLTSIRMAVHLILEERIGTLNNKQIELLTAAREDSERLNRIIDNLLDMGRIESGREMMDLNPVSPARLAQQAIEPLRSAFQDRNVHVKLDLASDLPEVMADETRIAHVFSNLLTNALKFTPPGGAVEISGVAQQQFVRFAVIDTGPGIPAEYLPRIFERFFRVPNQNRTPGAGLGLAIAREIISAHGGQISAQSQLGSGAIFTFTLPRAKPS